MRYSLFPTLAAALLLATSALPIQAAGISKDSHLVTQAQIALVHVGASPSEVITILGSPEMTTHWLNGTYSLDYHLDPRTVVYVDVNEASGTVIGYSIVGQD